MKVTARSSAQNGRPVAAAGLVFGKSPVELDATEDQLLDLFARRDRLTVTWPAGWTDPTGAMPGGPLATETSHPAASGPSAAVEPPASATPPPTPLTTAATLPPPQGAAASPPPPAPAAPRADARFCCIVGAHPHADTIDRELRAGGRTNSIRKVAARWKLNKSSTATHLSTCLGLDSASRSLATTGHPLATVQAPTPPLDMTRVQDPGQAVGQLPDAGQVAAIQVISSSPAADGRARARHLTRQEKIASEEAQKVEAERVKTIADLVNTCQWKDRETVVGLSIHWKIPEEHVQRLHALAAAKLSANRGSRRAALESSVAHTRRVRDAEATSAVEHQAAAEKIAGQTHPDKHTVHACRMHTVIAETARTNELGWQKHLDTLLGLVKPGGGPGAFTLNVAISTAPDFVEAWKVVAQVLDAFYPRRGSDPGAAATALEALGVFEDDPSSLPDWIAEQKANREAITVDVEPT